MLTDDEKALLPQAGYFGRFGLGVGEKLCPVGIVAQSRGARFKEDRHGIKTVADKDSLVIVDKAIEDLAHHFKPALNTPHGMSAVSDYLSRQRAIEDILHPAESKAFKTGSWALFDEEIDAREKRGRAAEKDYVEANCRGGVL